MVKKKYSYIDLFSGSGGLSLGFDRAGFSNIFSIDIEPSFCATYRKNFPKHHLIQADITKLSNDEILKIVGNKQVDIIVGGPPCQGFSMAGNPGRTFVDDPRNHLFKEFARVVGLLKPRTFLMENVARLFTHNNGKTRQEILNTFNKLGYTVECRVLDTANYRVPQHRRRIIFIGVLNDEPIIFPKPTSKMFTVKDAIDDLPKLASGEMSLIPNHQAMKHSEKMLAKMSFIKDGGNRDDIPLELRPLKGDIRKYIRYDSKKPSICITGDMRKVFHYNQNRALTVRELARIQTYPDDFIFEGSLISQQQQVGNSVPPVFAEELAKCIKEMLDA